MDDEALVDIEARRVLADAQMRRGDPRGELFALQDALARAPGDRALAAQIDQLVVDHHDALYGPVLAPLVRHPRGSRAPIEIAWRLGLAADWMLHDAPALDYFRAFADPLARHLQRLELAGFEPADIVRPWSALRAARTVVPHLRALTITAATIEDLGDVIGELPALDELVLSVRGSAGRLVAPKLAHLELSAMDAMPLVETDLPTLRDLRLRNVPRAGELVSRLADWPALRHLRKVRIVNSALGAAGLDRILARASAFAHLELLDLSHNGLDRARVRDARDAIPNLQIEPMALGAG